MRFEFPSGRRLRRPQRRRVGGSIHLTYIKDCRSGSSDSLLTLAIGKSITEATKSSHHFWLIAGPTPLEEPLGTIQNWKSVFKYHAVASLRTSLRILGIVLPPLVWSVVTVIHRRRNAADHS